MFYTTGSFGKSFKELISSTIQTGSLHMVRQQSKVIKYLEYKQHGGNTSMVMQVCGASIPMHSYIINADDIELNSYVQNAKEAMNPQKAEDIGKKQQEMFLFYNGNIYGTHGVAIDVASNLRSKVDLGDMEIDMLTGESYMEDETTQVVDTAAIPKPESYFSLEVLKDYDTLVKNCYVQDGTVADSSLFQVDKFMEKDLKLEMDSTKPQILIYHTHSQEAFYDSREGKIEDTIVGVGEVLANILREQYGINVMHDTSTYDLLDGKLDRNVAYNVAKASLEKTLEFNPSIQVMVDLHRDGVPAKMGRDGGKRVTTIGGEDCAQIMLFNGISANTSGPIAYLPNDNLDGNLAFSFQMFYHGKENYGELFRPIYLKPYRFNLHLKPRSTLVELGTQFNTVAEAKNSMKYLAETLVSVLEGK